MRRLRVGIIIRPEVNPLSGGTYSYFKTLLEGINNYQFSDELEIINIITKSNPDYDLVLKKETLCIKGNVWGRLRNRTKKVVVRNGGLRFKLHYPILLRFSNYINGLESRRIEKQLRRSNIDLIYYLIPDQNILNYTFITTHWDVAHRSMPAFPETSLDNNYESREKYYTYVLSKAFSILCESDAGEKELRKYYSFHDDKIKVLPLFSSRIIYTKVSQEQQTLILDKYNLEKGKYFFYPAQFWACKNHYSLVSAFREFLLETNNLKIKLVLTGSDMGNQKYIERVVATYSLTNNVIIPGFVDAHELVTLYSNAAALTMPTFLGPTNMPIIEAAHLRCPVICSDFEGHREILGSNALYVHPTDIIALKNSMQHMLDCEANETFKEKAYQHIKNSKFNIKVSLEVLNEILLEIRLKRQIWN